jgi:hypothetical protein
VEEVAGDVGEGGEEEVTEAVAPRAGPRRGSELEELRHQRLDLGQRDETVADVARREHPQLVAEPPELPPSSVTVTMAVKRRHAAAEVALERRENHREARAAADGDRLAARRPAVRALPCLRS